MLRIIVLASELCAFYSLTNNVFMFPVFQVVYRNSLLTAVCQRALVSISK
jgi:hypothetical protein